MAVIPAGKPTGVPIPTAPVVTCVIFVKAVCSHKVRLEEGVLTVFAGLTIIFPVALILPQPPVSGIV